MPPGMQHHIWPGAMQRLVVVGALWLAFYQHIWLQKISVLLDPGKIHITCILRSTENNKPQKMVFQNSLPGKELKPCHKQILCKCKYKYKYAEKGVHEVVVAFKTCSCLRFLDRLSSLLMSLSTFSFLML